MTGSNEIREQWLKDSENYFRSVQSYNSTVITIGFGTFFGLLLFLQGKVSNKLLFIASILIIISAGIFITFELINNISLAIQTSRLGKEGKRFFRFWAWFFIPSVFLAVVAIILLVSLFVSNLHQDNNFKQTQSTCTTTSK